MSVLVYAESVDKSCRKSAFEAVTMGKLIADLKGTDCIAMTIGPVNNAGDLGHYGASAVKNVSLENEHFDESQFAKIIAETASRTDSAIVVMSHSAQGKALAGRLAVLIDAGLVTAVNAPPQNNDHLQVKKSVYSGKATVTIQIESPKAVITVQGNSIPPVKTGTAVDVESLDVEMPPSSIKVETLKREDDVVPLPDAELVVSGGRGFKGPENWSILEDLARELGAATACSRPVADSGWRPHHEHVGQTGVAIRPNLYVAIGISGAIQHLGGVNNSKNIVVINKDPEAPFFKAADYGVVGDLFDVVPRLTEAVRRFKAANG